MALVVRQGISIIFPAYNEEANIANMVAQAMEYGQQLFRDWEIIIVNDGSRNHTDAIINRLAAQYTRVTSLHHPSNQGYGAALNTGIQRARKELIFFCDADQQFHLSELRLLLPWIEHYDIVIGYRAKRRDSLYRRLQALGWNTLMRLLFGLKVRDINCAFKLFRRVVFEAITINGIVKLIAERKNAFHAAGVSSGSENLT